MNRLAGGTIVLLSFWLLVPNLKADNREIDRARQRGARGQVTFRVVNSHGMPVEKANVRATFSESDSYGHVKVVKGQTDRNGLLVAAGKTIHFMQFDIKRETFYSTEGKYWFYREGEDCVQDGRWLPWNPTNTVVLKERRNPIPMYAKHLDLSVPLAEKPIGLDLEKGDWVAPHGKGVRADLLVEFRGLRTAPQEYVKRLEITFGKDSKDGLQVLVADAQSEFRSVYDAPEGDYVPRLVLERERTKEKILRNVELGDDRYLVIRVRTVMDKDGKILRANFGKIFGPIEYGRMGDEDRLTFTYYLNPTANDRNLEFDPSRNLFGTTDRRRVYRP